MTIAELRDLPLWAVLPAAIRKMLDEAEGLGWDLHGRGATIAFRLDRAEDELDLPCFAMWEIGKTPKGAVSFRGGKASVPHKTLSVADLSEYLNDPTVVYPLDEEPPLDEAEKAPEDTEDTPPWDETKTDEENLSASLGATLISDRPAPKPLRVNLPSPQSSEPSRPLSTSAGTPGTGTRSSVPSTTTARPLRVTTPQPSASSATHATSGATAST